MSDVTEGIKTADELLEKSLEIARDKKTTGKALSEVKKRLIKESGADKNLLKGYLKIANEKGRAWVGSALTIDPDAKHKDSTSTLFAKVLALFQATEHFNDTEILSDYLNELKNAGITITVDSGKFAHADTTAVKAGFSEEVTSAKSYMRTLESYSDQVKDELAPLSEELNFTPAASFSKIAGLYGRAKAGKEIDDAVQTILLNNEMLSTAANLVKDSVVPTSEE